MFEGLLSKLNSSSKDFIGISLSANGMLEVAQVSRLDHMVKKYTNSFVNYNAINREPDNYTELANKIVAALDELKIEKNSNVTFSLPNVLFGITTLPEILGADDITNAITTIVEDSYIFKREEPVVSWYKLATDDEGQQKIAYSALQDSVLREIKTLCTDIGLNLISVQNSNSTLLEGLDFCEIAENFAKDKQPWNILLISSTSYSIFSFEGEKLEDFYEEPLAIKSFTPEEVYIAVSSMAAPALQNYPAQKYLIISETDEISAEVISAQLGLTGDIVYLEQNKYQQRPPLDVDLNVLPGLIPQISIPLIGSSVDHFEDKYVKFNYAAAKDAIAGFSRSDLITIGDFSIELTKEKATKLTGLICGILAIVFLVFGSILNGINNNKTDELSVLKQEETKLQAELKQNTEKPAAENISVSIGNIINSNRKKLLYYDALSYGIPPKLWIKYFYAGDGDAIAITGAAVDSNDIASFLKGIREVAGESEVSVNKLIIEGSDDVFDIDSNGPEIYSFELANKAYKTKLENKDNQQNAQAQNQSGQQRPGQNQPQTPQQPQQQNNNIPPANSASTPPPLLPN